MSTERSGEGGEEDDRGRRGVGLSILVLITCNQIPIKISPPAEENVKVTEVRERSHVESLSGGGEFTLLTYVGNFISRRRNQLLAGPKKCLCYELADGGLSHLRRFA